MADRLNVYILGDFKSGTASGLAEFNYQNVILLKDIFFFHFIEFDLQQNRTYYQLEYREGIPVHRFGFKGSLLQLPGLFRSWLTDLPKENAVFHLNHIYNINNYLVARALVRENIPYLVTPHDSYVYCSDFNKDKPFLKRLYRDIFVKIFDKYVLSHAVVIHALTRQCTSCIQLLTRSPVIIVANQVKDMDLSFDISAIKPQVCYIGRFDIWQKGIDLALKAFQLFKQQANSGENITFTLVGPADADAVALRRNICQDLGLNIGDDVVFTGEIPTTERNRILSQSKVYIHLSRFEGFGLSIIQALSSYKPVIVSSQIPISDRIIAYKAGFVVNNSEEAARALRDIFALSSDEYTRMAANARHCYEQEFHPDVIKPQFARLYKETIKGKKTG